MIGVGVVGAVLWFRVIVRGYDILRCYGYGRL